ncbi:Ig-like domain-containing protein [Shiella aurantiaca]|nr:T9SS type A sorting domain-containing protein [Shiella aurantiaca]
MKTIRFMAVMLFMSIFAFTVKGQVINITDFPDPVGDAPFYTGESAAITFDAADYAVGTRYYLTTDNTLSDQDAVLASRTSAASAALNFTWPANGNHELFLIGATGNFEVPEVDYTAEGLVSTLGTNSVSPSFYMNRSGARWVQTTQPGVSTNEKVRLNVRIGLDNVVADNAIVVQFSTNGGSTWTDLTDTNADLEWLGLGWVDLQFDLQDAENVAAKNANTLFRVYQKSSQTLTLNQQSWYLDYITVETGEFIVIEGAPESVAVYTVSTPFISVTEIQDAADNPIHNGGGTAYPGDEIEVIASYDGFDIADYDFFVRLEDGSARNFTLGSPTVSTPNPNEIRIVGTLPVGITYNDNFTVEINAVPNGESLNVDYMQDVDFINDDLSEFTILGGTQTGNGVEFELEGERSVATPAMVVPASLNLTAEFYMERINGVQSPEGTNIIFEYSTNGGTTYTQLASIPLNDSLAYGNTVIVENLSAGIATNATIFRFRQEANNGLELDSWFIADFTIYGNSNIVGTPDMAYNQVGLDIDEPTIELAPLDLPDQTYPGEDIDLVWDVTEGAFAAGTNVTAYLYVNSKTFVLGEAAVTAGTLATTVPPLVNGDYTIELMTSNEVYSNTITLSVYQTTLEITDVTSTSGIVEGGATAVYPGGDIEVSFTSNLPTSTTTEVILAAYDYTLGEYVIIGSTTNITNGAGTVNVASLPTDIDYNSGGAAELKLYIGNGILTNGTYETIYSGNPYLDDAEDEEWPMSLATGYSGTWMNLAGTRSMTSIPFDIRFGSRVQPRIYLSTANGGVFDADEYIKFQGSTDGGVTWVTIDSVQFTCENCFVMNPGLITLDDELEALVSESTIFRIIYNESGQYLENQYQAYFQFARVDRIIQLEAAEAYSNFNLILPTVSLETIEDTDFYVGQTTTIEFNTVGTFPDNTTFAVVIEGPDFYETIGETTDQGAVDVDVTFPRYAFDENDDPMFTEIKIVPYTKVPASTTYMQSTEINIEEEEDFLKAVGDGDLSTYSNFYFNQAGDREILTKAYDLFGADEVTLNFYLELYDGLDVMSNELTLPRLQTSVDGGATFQDVAVYENAMLADGLLYSDGWISVVLDASLYTTATHFRWVQTLNLGAGRDDWYIQNISLEIGTNNEVDIYYEAFNMPQAITLGHPDLNDYLFSVVNGTTDPIFNGETFTADWSVNPERFEPTMYPAGTMFTFSLDATDPETGENLVLAEIDAEGNFDAVAPEYLERDDYNVYVTAYFMLDEETMYIYEDESWVGEIDVFNRVIKPVYLGGNEVVYAGNEVSFSILVENEEETEQGFYDELFYNLILEYNGDSWLLAAQEGRASDFTVQIPPFVTGNVDFEVRGSIGGPLGTIGDIIEDDQDIDLNPTLSYCSNINGSYLCQTNFNENFINAQEFTIDDSYNNGGTFYNNSGDDFSYTQFQNVSGLRKLTTIDLDLTGAKRIEFNLFMDYNMDELTADQMLVLEYSTDAGATYTTLATYPDARYEEEDEVYERLPLPEAARTAATRIRWRQNEAKGTVRMDNMNIAFNEEFPFELVSAEIPDGIKAQAIQVTSVESLVSCAGEPILLNYEVLGQFGEMNSARVRWKFNGSTTNGYATLDWSSDYQIADFTDASGQLEVFMPVSFFDTYGYSNQNVVFRIETEDLTYQEIGYDYTRNGSYSELPVELISPVNVNGTTIYYDGSDFACADEDREVWINSPQDYFTYTVRNRMTGEVLGTPFTYDPESGLDTKINIGKINARTEIEMLVTAQSMDASVVCSEAVLNSTDEIYSYGDFELKKRVNFSGVGNQYVDVTEETLCEGAVPFGLWAVATDDKGDVTTGADNVKWYKDDLTRLVQTGNNFTGFANYGSGTFFAVVTEGDCEYQTASVTITVVETPDKPEITADGPTEFCQGGSVTLTATAGYEFYRWYRNGTQLNINSSTLTVEDNADYYVQVSNVPFTVGCGSQNSLPIRVTVTSIPDVYLYSNAWGNLEADQSIVVCDDPTSLTDNYYLQVQNAGSSTVRWFRDGVEINPTSSNTGQSIEITASGEYYAEVQNENLASSCIVETPRVNITYDVNPLRPDMTVTVDGAAFTGTYVEFCAGEEGEVVLSGPAGFASYYWDGPGLGNGNNVGTQEQSITVTDAGTYSLYVVNANGCWSEESLEFQIDILNKPNDRSLSYIGNDICDSGAQTFQINNPEANVVYQLIDAETGAAAGDAVVSNGSNGQVFITTPVVSENTRYILTAHYGDNSSCVMVSTNEYEVFVNSIELVVVGNRITAQVQGNNVSGQWYRNGAPMMNASNTSSIVVFDDAEYSVEIEYGDCMLTASTADLAGGGRVLGVREGLNGTNVNLYPNPTNDKLNITLTNGFQGEVTLRVISISGQQMLEQVATKQSEQLVHELSIGHLQEGMYMLQVISGDKSEMVRIMKK